MANKALLIVHVGYITKSNNHNKEVYGDYEIYLQHIKQALTLEQTMVLTDKNCRIPFELPKHVEILHSSEHDYLQDDIKVILPKLNAMDVSTIDIGGEFLWQWAGDINANLKIYIKNLPDAQQARFKRAYNQTLVLDDAFAKKAGLDLQKFMQEIVYSGEQIVTNGCVKIIADALSYWGCNTNLRRELCYPSIDPPSRS